MYSKTQMGLSFKKTVKKYNNNLMSVYGSFDDGSIFVLICDQFF